MRGSVHGCVISADNQAVENATITLLSGRGPIQAIGPRTDSGGCFALDELAEGKWVLSAATPEGPKGTATVYVFDNAVSDVTIQIPGLSGPQKPAVAGSRKITQPPEKPQQVMWGSVRGRVLQADNEQPVSGAEINIVRGPAGGAAIEPMIRTDRDGWFSHSVTEGEWVLAATTSTGRGEAAVSVFANATSELTIYFSEKPQSPRRGSAGAPAKPVYGIVHGLVVRADTGEPVVDATVAVEKGPGPSPDAQVTDRTGRFVLSLTEGEWVISAATPTGAGHATVRVFADSTSEVTIKAPGSTRPPRRGSAANPARKDRSMSGGVQGLVMRADTGQPIADATIVVVRGPGPAQDIAPLTDSAGRFSLDPLSEGEWVLRAITPDHEIGEATVRVSTGSTAQIRIEVGRQ